MCQRRLGKQLGRLLVLKVVVKAVLHTVVRDLGGTLRRGVSGAHASPFGARRVEERQMIARAGAVKVLIATTLVTSAKAW